MGLQFDHRVVSLIEAIFRRRVPATRSLAAKRSGGHAYAMNDTETDY